MVLQIVGGPFHGQTVAVADDLYVGERVAVRQARPLDLQAPDIEEFPNIAPLQYDYIYEAGALRYAGESS